MQFYLEKVAHDNSVLSAKKKYQLNKHQKLWSIFVINGQSNFNKYIRNNSGLKIYINL